MTNDGVLRASDLWAAGRVLAAEGLVNAFGHVSVRLDETTMVITPPVALGTLTADSAGDPVDLAADDLPAGTPKEAWIHVAIYRARPDVTAICRAQPEHATALASAGVPIRPLHGQGSFLGAEVPVFEDSRLVRDASRAESLAAVLGSSEGLVMRGNGAVTVGSSLGEAVGRMWVLEKSARMNSIAAAAGAPTPLPQSEQDAWAATSSELLGRIWTYLTDLHAPSKEPT
ncbi:class II aldolase/adducin family protein [Granulicoccus sp. GXG6511]|uniref:class II aldolase/adducin family protein n=1 Tax=Granulicoccus sp. GXG6511 TaxID=3381351 RepID=UPI003D7DA669